MHRLFAAIAFLLLAYAATGTVDYKVAQGIAEEQADLVGPRQGPFTPVLDPVNPPRCPKINAERLPLLRSVAVQSDGGEWQHSCIYGIET